MSDPARIGLCGGTFDPFHRGHLQPIAAVFETLGWSKVVFIPANRQPFKADRVTASAFDRFAMAILGTLDDERFEVSPVELERGEVSYTVDTLEHFRERYPESTLDWIVGDDNLELLPKWKSIDRIFELANFVVLRRDVNASVPATLQSRRREARYRDRSGSIVMVENLTVPISATAIRERIARGESIRDLVDPRVERYIDRYGLYR